MGRDKQGSPTLPQHESTVYTSSLPSVPLYAARGMGPSSRLPVLRRMPVAWQSRAAVIDGAPARAGLEGEVGAHWGGGARAKDAVPSSMHPYCTVLYCAVQDHEQCPPVR